MELRDKYETQYRRARMNLLLMAVLTTVNVLLLVVNANYSFAFSASLPQITVSISQALAVVGAPAVWVAVFAALTVLLLAAFFVCWGLSVRRGGWLLAAMVLFALDCGGVIYLVVTFWNDGEVLSLLLDVLFHAWVMWYLVSGVMAWGKLRQLPSREELAAAQPAANESAQS